MRQRDHMGERYGRLVIVGVSERRYRSWSLYECVCDCGGVIHRRLSALTSGNTRSCGCLKRESNANGTYRLHGKTGTRVYRTWRSMVRRCSEPKNVSFKTYGGRGIKVCERWSLFPNFLADMGEPPTGCTLERINNDGNYEPDNCRWATLEAQANNKSTSVFLTVNGITKTLAQWSKATGINSTTINWRISSGWSPVEAVGRAPSFLKREVNADV